MTTTESPEGSTEPSVLDLVGRLFSLEQELLEDPYPVYARMREQAPVVRWGPMVAVARNEDVKTVLRDTKTFSSVRVSGSRVKTLRAKLTPEDAVKFDALVGNESSWLVEIDDPDHARLRRFVNTTFSAPRINKMRADVEKIARDLLDAADATDEGQAGRIELVESFCYKLPLYVICTLLGASDEDTEKVRTWSDAIGVSIGTEWSNLEEAHQAFSNFQTYVRGLIERSRSTPGASDLFSELVATDDNGTFLTDDELVGMFTLLLFAGHETTTNLIANAVIALLEHPDQLALIRSGDPRATKGAVDEFFRYCTSIQAVHRVATQDTEVAGFAISKGETVRVLLASANHDPAVFEDPETFDLTRTNAKKHVGLGFGVHTCLGIWLTRLEIEVGVAEILRRYPDLALSGPYSLRRNFTLHGPERLHLTH